MSLAVVRTTPARGRSSSRATRRTVELLGEAIDRDAMTAVWERALSSTWARGRGWALWKALILRAGLSETTAVEFRQPDAVRTAVLVDRPLRRGCRGAGRPPRR
jgi:hypothetical protein